MGDVAIKIKYIGVTAIVIILGVILFRILYVNWYIASYKEIELNEISKCTNKNIHIETPYWTSVYDDKIVNELKDKYDVNINIDLQKSMLIVSYGAELVGLDYNILEYTYHSRGSYVGFPCFDNIQKNTVYFYQSELVPIMNTDMAGYAPEYNGKYRK